MLLETPLDVSRMIFMLYQDVEQQINRADLKSQVTLSTASILAANGREISVRLGFAGATGKWGGVEWGVLVLYSGLCAVSTVCLHRLCGGRRLPPVHGKE